ncbi:MAG: AmmeMemoRadiSam system radical SAM enzyme, partial [Kiritimatiellia bacterium]|nr:AmmeMemoRadiSam system radical SAM enzyme [Kiritimatiellia bacterium]
MNAICQESLLSRRDFVKIAGVAAAHSLARPHSAQAAAVDAPHEASFYKQLQNNEIMCELCPFGCTVKDGKRGRCRVRENRGGKYYTLVYGRPVALNNDPVEKKPFFHVYPGSKVFSIATVGCNIRCKFCQNWEISQANPGDIRVRYIPPAVIAATAKRVGAKAVAYTYSEPTIFYEYMTDCAKAARDMGLGNIMISNGFMQPEPLKQLVPLMTAIKIDLKAFNQKFYGKVCGGLLTPVLDTLKRLSGHGVWFEIVVLLIPTLNDNMDDIRRMSEWIVKEIGPNVPLHFTRFHPCYKIRNLPRTPPKILHRARSIAMASGCNFV